MSLQNIKNQKGFTIVELLIVIVVIGILAAITIVAFNGVQDRGNTTRAQSVASDVQKKAEAFNAENQYYPDAADDFTGIAALSKGNNVITTGSPTGDARKTTAVYTVCPATATGANVTGARIQFWDFTTKALTPTTGTDTKTITVGTCS